MLPKINEEIMTEITKLENGEIALSDFAIFVLQRTPISDDVEKKALETIRKLFQKKPIGRPKKVNDEAILILKIYGYTQNKIVAKLGVSRSTVQRAWLNSKLEESLRIELLEIEKKENDTNGKKDG